jgi:hypothetical protein
MAALRLKYGFNFPNNRLYLTKCALGSKEDNQAPLQGWLGLKFLMICLIFFSRVASNRSNFA